MIADCRILFIVVLNVVMLSVIMLIVVMLSAVMPSRHMSTQRPNGANPLLYSTLRAGSQPCLVILAWVKMSGQVHQLTNDSFDNCGKKFYISDPGGLTRPSQ
jgi:hypothetical protein